MNRYAKASQYPDLAAIYSECSGPGGLKLAEFIADQLSFGSNSRLIDIGMNRGLQTCFLARAYGAQIVGIDPEPSNVERLADNAKSWRVSDQVLAIRASVPETGFANDSFDLAYSTTTFEMIRGFHGEEAYRRCLSEVLRILRPGALFGFGEPMHLDVDIPPDLSIYTSGSGAGPDGWAKCFATIDETIEAFQATGFEVVRADYAPDAWEWWDEFSKFGSGGRESDVIQQDGGRWISYGYVIAKKPD